MKTFILSIVSFMVGLYLGSFAMQRQIADKFAQGEGRAICETILQGSQ